VVAATTVVLVMSGCAALDGVGAQPTLTLQGPTPDVVDGATGAVATYTSPPPGAAASHPAGTTGTPGSTTTSRPRSTTAGAAHRPAPPAGHVWVRLNAEGVLLPVPKGWVPFSLSTDPQQYTVVAESMGLSVQQVQQLTTLGFMVLMRSPEVPSRSNLNALRLQGVSVLPTAAELSATFTALHARNVQVTTVSTPLGRGLQASWRLVVAGIPLEQRLVMVVVGKDLVQVTVTDRSATRADSELRVVARSIRRG
jgi:hypothetical protein